MLNKKFRVWDKKKKKWVEGFFITKDGSLFYLGNSEPITDGILIQFTGQTDKNDKEIWEGDIVRFKKYIGVVDFDFESFIINCDEDYSFYDHMGDLFSWDELEVIGNRFENPELLEKK